MNYAVQVSTTAVVQTCGPKGGEQRKFSLRVAKLDLFMYKIATHLLDYHKSILDEAHHILFIKHKEVGCSVHKCFHPIWNGKKENNS